MKSSVSPGMVVSALVPALLAAAGATATSSAAHDLDVVRTVGAGFAGPGGGAFRGLDMLVAAPALLLPLGTRVLRAGLASAVVAGLCGALAFGVARRLVAVVSATLHRPSPRLEAAVSTVAVLTALLAPAWQAEASAPGGAVTGALLVLAALQLGTAPAAEVDAPASRWLPPALLVLGLAASYEPLVFIAALAALGPRLVLALRERVSRPVIVQSAVAFGLGLVPLALGALLLRRPFDAAVTIPGPLFSLAAESTGAPFAALPAFASAHVGVLLLLVCAVGAALSFYVKAARPVALPLALLVVAGVVAFRYQGGAVRVAAPVLVGVLALFILGSTALGAIVFAIARARVPFAEASAALVLVLELVLPVRAMDETATRRDARAARASSIWNDIAWGEAPPAAVVLVADRGTMRRVASARATGELRGDLLIVPAFDVHGQDGQRALLAEPKLAPLYRDMALGVPPEELSLAQLAAQRPVLATFDPRWDRTLARHLVPVGLTSRFEPEPRGASDRKKSLDMFLTAKDRLVRVAVAKKDSELAAATATLLRARAVGMAATGERDILSRALDDLRAFAPEDQVGATLVRRIVTSKGPIDVRDLSL